MTQRDRILLMAVAVLAVMAGGWFGILGPKRKEAGEWQQKATAMAERRDKAVTEAAGAEAAKAAYQKDYATVARLGKAVPAGEDTASVVYQLEAAARRAKIDFRSVKLTGTSAPAPAAATGAGATGGGVQKLPFTFTFDGDFFALGRMLELVDSFTAVQDGRLDVKGRLLSVDGFSLTKGRRGFPQVKAQLAATAYVTPQTPGASGAAGATPPAGGAAATPPTPSSGGAGGPPSTPATVSGAR